MTASPEGRPIAAVPLAHLLVLPRSLLILSSSLYTSHLHGISARTLDSMADGLRIANADLVGESGIVDAIRDKTWSAARSERTSLTFRHANKVFKGGAFALANGALRRT